MILAWYSVKDTLAFEQAHEALTECTAYVFLLLWLMKRQRHDCTRCWAEVGEMGLLLMQALAVAEVAEPCMARGVSEGLKTRWCLLCASLPSLIRLIHTADSVCIGQSVWRGRKATYWHPISWWLIHHLFYNLLCQFQFSWGGIFHWLLNFFTIN
jgi:hypothetical protein